MISGCAEINDAKLIIKTKRTNILFLEKERIDILLIVNNLCSFKKHQAKFSRSIFWLHQHKL